MDKDKALQRFLNSRGTLKAVLANLTGEQITSLMVEGSWTVKEVLCHFIGWDKTLLEPLGIFLATGTFPVQVIQNHDLHNTEQTSIRQGLSFEKIVDEYNLTSQQLLELVARLDSVQSQTIFPAPWGGESTIPGMLAGLAWHVDEHLKNITAAIKQS